MGGITRMMGRGVSGLKKKQARRSGIENAKTRGKASVGLSNKSRRKPALTGIANAMTRGKASVGLAHKRTKPSYAIASNPASRGYSKLGQMFSSMKKKKRKKRRRVLG